MRKLSLDIPERLVREARLYAVNPTDVDAVCHVLEDYGRLVKQIRDLRARIRQFDDEAAAFDARFDALQRLCRDILEL